MRVSFGRFVFDSDARELSRDGSPVALTPKALSLLELLVRHRGRAVTKKEIHDELWPQTFVSDASLSNLVAELRAALGDDAQRPRFVRTARRYGYAFIGELSRTAAAGIARRPSRLVWASREIELPVGETIVGREVTVGVWIDDASVSRHHARIVLDETGAELEDLGSKNGTLLNGKLLGGAVRLADGDCIRIGRADLVFRETSTTRSTQTARGTAASRADRRARSRS